MADFTVATIIQQQLFAGGRNKVYSWGARYWKAGENFLYFRVSAHRHKGYVKITLNSLDTYDVQLISMKRVVKKEWNGLYCDQLTEVIDNEIEKLDSYRY